MRSSGGTSRVRWLRVLAGALGCLLLFVLAWAYLHHLMQYATLADLAVRPSKEKPGLVKISYVPESAGRIEFVRQSAGRCETLIEHAEEEPGDSGSRRQFDWAGNASESYSIRVRYRSGLRFATKEWHSAP